VRQAHHIQQLGHPRLARRGAQVFDAKGDVVGHAEVGKQGVVLEHHADLSVLWRDVQAGAAEQAIRDPDGPFAGPFQAGDGAQQAGLAAARRPDEHADLSGGQAQCDAVGRCSGGAGVMQTDVFDLEEHAPMIRGLVQMQTIPIQCERSVC
jgi:hypothetical protein